MFKRYNKIHRLGKEEVDGILEGTVHVQEKIDGANTSIWVEDKIIHLGSRNQDITYKTFNGFHDYVLNHEGIQRLLQEHPTYRLYGEWLVRHTIGYAEKSYKHFYLFDITDAHPQIDEDEQESFFKIEIVNQIAKEYGILTPQYHGTFKDAQLVDLMPLVGKSVLGENGEGIVIKNELFRDKFGSHNYAKIVTETFKEDNGVTFGGNNKHSDSYWEMYVVNKYITLARVEKIMNKLQPLIDKRLDLEHIPRISNTVYHDMLTEEIWEIQGKVQTINFNSLKRIALKKAVSIYKEILSGDISVAHANKETPST